MADEYGVNKSSYDPVLLPNIKAYQVTCKALGSPNEVLDLGTEAIPKELEWGEVRGGRTDRWLGCAARRGSFSCRPTFCHRCW